jgi:hypothetical protein
MATLKKIGKWIWTHSKIVLFIILVIFISVFVLWWGRKNRKIKSLEHSLAIMQAKLSVERLTVKYDANVEKLKELKNEDEKLQSELKVIEASLENRLKPEMTADEIIAKFKEVGLDYENN